MADSKPFASLSSTLLARKGAAKPAMRPQGFGQGVSLEDLGWNDMGFAPPSAAAPEPFVERAPSPISALTPAPRTAAPEAPPVVVEQQRAIEESFTSLPQERAPLPSPIPPMVQLPRDRRGTAKAKAAFTLRLDAERHLKLRLACAVNNRSAQQMVTEALDGFLESLPELDAMARQAAAGHRN